MNPSGAQSWVIETDGQHIRVQWTRSYCANYVIIVRYLVDGFFPAAAVINISRLAGVQMG
jgi:hypothetical protein